MRSRTHENEAYGRQQTAHTEARKDSATSLAGALVGFMPHRIPSRKSDTPT